MELFDRHKSPTGRLVINVFERGRLVEHFDEQNLIVGGMSVVMASLLGGGAGAVTKIGFGTSGAAPSVGNTVLTGAYVKAIGAASYPFSGKVSFAFDLGGGEANGLAILEFGLLTASSILVARRVRPLPLNKTVALSLTGAWTIQF